MNNEIKVLSKYDKLVKEADERGLSLRYDSQLRGGVFYLTQDDSVIASNLDSLFSVENFLKGYQEGYRKCIKDLEAEGRSAKYKNISGLYE